MTRHQADVVVLGAGSAGIAAAVAAARNGRTVIVIDKNGFCGGTATTALVGTICGLFHRSTSSPVEYACSGFAREFSERLQKKSNTTIVSATEGLFFLPYEVESFKELCLELLDEEKITFFDSSVCMSVEKDGDKIISLMFEQKGLQINVQATSFVDATGEAEISVQSQAELLPEGPRQANAYVFVLEGVEDMEMRKLQLTLIKTIKQGIYSKQLDKDCERLTIVPGSYTEGKISFKLGLPLGEITEKELSTRVEKIVHFLSCELPAFKEVSIAERASQIGVRSGRRPVGLQVLCEEDVLNCQKFENGVVNAPWPMEEWLGGLKPTMTYFAQRDHYQIPSPVLISKKFNNLFFAGKSISATNKAIASARVMGTCLGTGFAAGTMAAFSSQGLALTEAVKEIRKEQVLNVSN